MSEKRKRRFGDRKDGRRVRSLPPMSYVAPYIMKTRAGAQNYFADSFDVAAAEKYITEKHREGYTDFGLLHVLIAAYIRTVAEKPGINRFLAGQRIYARDHVEVCMNVKRAMTLDAQDTCIKVIFDRSETAVEVYEKFNQVVQANKGDVEDTSFDGTARVLCHLPGLFLRFAIGFLNFLDYFGWLPKKLLDVSPFHGSMFITSMGSLGIPPIYHHLYDFGNLPIFIAYGAKRPQVAADREGHVGTHRHVGFTVVTDERICDGFYYASAFKQFKRYLLNPWALDEKPACVKEDVD